MSRTYSYGIIVHERFILDRDPVKRDAVKDTGEDRAHALVGTGSGYQFDSVEIGIPATHFLPRPNVGVTN
jgi:alpha-D-ribose 1-methylphosphonate 5-phosphate C-P lyase